MKVKWNLLAAVFVVLSLAQTASADWTYVETNTTSFTQNTTGKGYLTDGVWTIPTTRKVRTADLTVSGTSAVCESEEPTIWDFTNITSKTYPNEGPWRVVSFTGCSGVNISELIAPDCIEIKNIVFRDCKFLKRVYMPNCTFLGQATFAGCELLETMYFPKVSTILSECFKSTGFKTFVWDFPLCRNVPYSMFAYCLSLSRVEFKIAITNISESAFYDLAPAAELYMPAEAPKTIGENAFANGRYPNVNESMQRIYLKANYEDWLEAFRAHHSVIMLSNSDELADFNDGWSDTFTIGGTVVTRYRADVIKQMDNDPDICSIDDNGTTTTEDDQVTILKKGLLAYAVRKATGNAKYCYGCWIFKMPEKGLKVIVR